MTATVRYWAAIRAAAGAAQEQVAAGTVAQALEEVLGRHDGRFAQVLSVCSFVLDGDPVGGRDRASLRLVDGALLDCLPPFAGG